MKNHSDMQAIAAAQAVQLRRRLLGWFDRHGRQDLPWQHTRDPYRIWLSEIMLQQTQVSTVIPYYERFLKRFPDVRTVARARLDSVLHHWTGLGYYARARNLKRAAELIVSDHGGNFPRTLEAVTALPGIGRSTGGAILAFAFAQRHPILDGNVKRVLTRLHAIATPVAQRETEQSLWALAERYTPRTRIADYTQAIMDLGATLCRTHKPACPDCPVQSLCVARQLGKPEKFPLRVARPRLPVRQVAMLMIRDEQGRVLLTQRPPAGVWGGLWGFPECAAETSVLRHSRTTLGLRIKPAPPWPVRRHNFSHFQLHITPIPAQLQGTANSVMQCLPAVWYNLDKPDARGLAAPVKELLRHLQETGRRQSTPDHRVRPTTNRKRSAT